MQCFCCNELVGMKSKFLEKPSIIAFLAVIDFATYLIVARLSHMAAITHVVYLPNTFDFTVNIQRVTVFVL